MFTGRLKTEIPDALVCLSFLTIDFSFFLLLLMILSTVIYLTEFLYRTEIHRKKLKKYNSRDTFHNFYNIYNYHIISSFK